MKNCNTKILVCCHKPDQYKADDIYMPIQVGKANSEYDLGIQGDDQGDNISTKNGSYCELTGLYWAWKNLKDVNYIGLCHYRRYFNFNDSGLSFMDYVVERGDVEDLKLTPPDMEKLFRRYDVVLSKRRVFPYSIYTDYCREHYSKDIKITSQIIAEKFPDYGDSIKRFFDNENRLSPCNMFIMSWENLDSYCKWLFPVLEELERRIDISGYDNVQKRIYGFLAERLLNLYVRHNKFRVNYRSVYYLDKDNKNARFSSRLKIYINNSLSFAIIKKYRRKK